MPVEVRSRKGVNQSILVPPPLVALPSVILDDMRYPATDFGVHSWVSYRLFTLITRKFDRR